MKVLLWTSLDVSFFHVSLVNDSMQDMYQF
jgi:hypothetical protein